MIGLFWFTYTHQREPSYEGRSLSEWLRLYRQFGPGRAGDSKEAADAVRHIGTNALPFFVRWVQELQDMSPQRKHLWTMVGRWIPGPPREFSFQLIARRQLRAQRAFWGFEILGETARNVIPGLMREATQGDTQSARRAIAVLPYLGRDGIQPLLSVITNTALALPVRLHALTSLSQMGNLQAKVYPAALGTFGPNPRPAVPELTKLLSDPDASVRYATTNALHQIAPELLQQSSAP
jgi:hypothetical protein